MSPNLFYFVLEKVFRMLACFFYFLQLSLLLFLIFFTKNNITRVPCIHCLVHSITILRYHYTADKYRHYFQLPSLLILLINMFSSLNSLSPNFFTHRTSLRITVTICHIWIGVSGIITKDYSMSIRIFRFTSVVNVPFPE